MSPRLRLNSERHQIRTLSQLIEKCNSFGLGQYIYYTYLAKGKVTYKDLCEYIGNEELQQSFNESYRRPQ